MIRAKIVASNSGIIGRLHSELFPNDDMPDWSLGTWWVMFNKDVPIAFAGIQRSHRWSDSGYLVRAGVMPAERGKGFQKRLIKIREAYAKKQGWKWCITATLDIRSANNLINCGYHLYKPKNPWLIDGALYWRKQL